MRNVDQMGLKEIYEELKRVSKLCKELRIDKKEFWGFNDNFKSWRYWRKFFTPIINPPK